MTIFIEVVMQFLHQIILIGGFALTSTVALAGAPVDSGALDPTFGSGGKVQISATATGVGGSNLVAADVAVQSNGKTIVAGYNDNNDCVLARLNVDGSLDTSFGGTNSFKPGFAGYGNSPASPCARTIASSWPPISLTLPRSFPNSRPTACRTPHSANNTPPPP